MDRVTHFQITLIQDSLKTSITVEKLGHKQREKLICFQSGLRKTEKVLIFRVNFICENEFGKNTKI